MNQKISINPNICHGKPTITGTRVLVSNLLSSLAVGENFGDILLEYPNISSEDIVAALEFGKYNSLIQ